MTNYITYAILVKDGISSLGDLTRVSVIRIYPGNISCSKSLLVLEENSRTNGIMRSSRKKENLLLMNYLLIMCAIETFLQSAMILLKAISFIRRETNSME